jgi:DNA (cytosine-5)-methyltransferase 1
MTLTVGSLFSGIGGLDLGLERAGMEVIWQSEIDPYGCRVLERHWPEVVNHGNIKDINWRDVVRPDVICGGYPCQPFSTAGKRQGTDDPRHLWPWVREAISELRPRYAILENVRGHITLGLSTVLGQLAAIGYDAEWQIVSANSVGAPHRRERVIIVAYPNGRRLEECQSESEPTTGSSLSSEQCTDSIGQLANTSSVRRVFGQSQVFTADRWRYALNLIGSGSADVADTDDSRSGTSGRRVVSSENSMEKTLKEWRSRSFYGISGFSADVADTDGIGGSWQWWQIEPDVGRVAHGVPSRVDRLRGLGNAVVPQVAELVGRMVISHYEESI